MVVVVGGLSLSGGRRDVSNCWERRAIDAASSIDGIRTRLRAALLHRRRGGWRGGSHISMRFVCGSAVTPNAPPPHHHHHRHHPGSITSSQGGCERRINPPAVFAERCLRCARVFSAYVKCVNLSDTHLCRAATCFFFSVFFLRREPNYKHVEVDCILWTRRNVGPRSPPP